MNDTTPEITRIFRDLMMARSGEERLIMGSDMFDSAREIVLSSLRGQERSKIRHEIFVRIYGGDFEPSEMERILAAIRRHDAHPGQARTASST